MRCHWGLKGVKQGEHWWEKKGMMYRRHRGPKETQCKWRKKRGEVRTRSKGMAEHSGMCKS